MCLTATLLTHTLDSDRMKLAMREASPEEKMFRPEPLDLLLIAIVAILIFGANRLPEVARSIGQAIREFRNAFKEDKPQQ